MPVVMTKLFAVFIAALGFITITASNVILMTEEGEKMEYNYEQLTEYVSEEIKEQLDNDPDYFDEDGSISRIMQERLVDISIEQVIQNKIEENLPEGKELSDNQREVIEQELKKRIQKDVDDIIQEKIDQWNDEIEYHRNPLRYHGLKWSDFM